MSTQLKYFALPAAGSGLNITCPSSAWVFSAWQLLHQDVGREIEIVQLRCQSTTILGADSTIEFVLELGFGAQGSEVTKIALPFSYRNDTGVAYYLDPQSYFLPELVRVPVNTRLSVRAMTSSPSATISGIKIRYLAGGQIPDQAIAALPNNYRHIEAASGISVTEKSR